MTGQELMTAVEHDIPIKVIVCDNGVWGSIMNSQSSKYGDEKLFGTTIKAPEFCTLAEGYGCTAFKVDRTEDFPGAIAKALAHRGPVLIHVETDARDVSPYGPWDP
jgi:acetolactate synthase I/II/III large subunit